MEFRFILLFLITSVYGELCPKQCKCRMDWDASRAECVDQNITNVDIGVPRDVQVYSLRKNAITELDNFCFKNAGYSSIEVLNLSHNLIFWIGLHAFAGINELRHLDLSNNRLRQIPPYLFWDTPKLDFLNLSSNVFEEFKNEPFLIHDKLQVLNLNNCRIKSLPERLFKRLPNLRKLDISDNYMVTMKVDVLIPLRNIERIELKSQYWQCTPDLIKTKQWIQLKGLAYNNVCSKKRLPNMFEEIIPNATTVRPVVDVNDNISTTLITILLLGLLVLIILFAFVCWGVSTFLRRRQGRRSDSDQSNYLTSLISSSSIDPDLGTPQSSRPTPPPRPSRPTPLRPPTPPPRYSTLFTE